jgi:uncharacterized protein (TIGR03086 family)
VSPTAEAPDLVDLLVRASAVFGEQVASIPGDEWDLPTPCQDWDIKALVAHVVFGDAQLPDLVAGREVGAVELDVRILGPHPMSTWRGTALRAIEAARATPLDMRVRHPIGDLSFARVLGFRISDNAVHAWDLATARSDVFTIPDDIAAWCLDFWLPMADGLSESGFFAAMGEPTDDSPGARLLALLGRGQE